MTLLDDLLAWSGTLPKWQQDALRRLFVSGPLVEADFQELLHLLKVAHQVEPASEVSPIPLAADHIQAGANGSTVQLLALNNMTHVNGFPTGRSLTFSPQGMTVVFGENGAGKSGYARVLKNACRARKRNSVRPNAFDENRSRQTPSAEVQLAADGNLRNYNWVQDGPIDADLASVAVYDAACATSYIEAEGVPAFQPFGLSQVVAFAKMCGELERRVNMEITALPCDTAPFRGLLGETAVGRFIRSLSHASDITEARHLGILSEVEIARSAELIVALAELSPEPKALVLERLAARLDGLVTKVTQAHAYTTDRAVERLHGLVQANLEAGTTHQAAQQLLQDQDLLPGTGSDVWRALFVAARQFSIQLAYPGLDHPHTENAARCVLCQTELNLDAQTRMQTFAAFVSSSTATAADIANTNLTEANNKISQADFTLGIDKTLMGEIMDIAPALYSRLSEWMTAWTARREWMLAAIQTNHWDARPDLPADPSLDTSIRETASTLRANAQILRRSIDPQQRAQLQSELGELQARQALAPHVPAVEQFIINSRKAQSLRNCLTNLGSGPISRQLTTFADTYITQALVDAMLDELNKLGYHRSIRHRVPRRTERGVTLVRVSLEGTTDRTEEVLSEGEQRATALAFFLAEMRLASVGSTLVFDDPVTSMDHNYRNSVATRLAQIANDRQVIIFTHDAVFLMALHHACSTALCQVEYRTIEWDEAPGRTFDGLNWDHMKSGQRMNAMKQQLSEIRVGWGEYPSEGSKKKMTDAYTHLRGTIERIIREDLVNGVIQPYSDEVNVENFTAVVGIDPAEWDALLDVYDHACEVTRAHDTTSERQAVIPAPNRLQADIAVLESVITNARARKAKASETRAERGRQRRSSPK